MNKLTYLVILVSFFIPALCEGNIYVKNLHKKCLSAHQKCYFICASEFIDQIEPDDISHEASNCANNCMIEYKTCERVLDKLRIIDRSNPLLPNYEDIPTRPKEENEK